MFLQAGSGFQKCPVCGLACAHEMTKGQRAWPAHCRDGTHDEDRMYVTCEQSGKPWKE